MFYLLSRPLPLRVMPHRGLSFQELVTTVVASLRLLPLIPDIQATAATANPLEQMLNLKPITEAIFAW